MLNWARRRFSVLEEINWEYISARCCLPVSTEYNTRLTGYSTLFCIIVNMGRRGLVEEKFRPNCLKSENKWERWFTIIESSEQIGCNNAAAAAVIRTLMAISSSISISSNSSKLNVNLKMIVALAC